MSEAPGRLRSAADHLDDARTDLEYGDLDLNGEEVQETPGDIDDVIADLQEVLRELAIQEEVAEAAGEDDDE